MAENPRAGEARGEKEPIQYQPTADGGYNVLKDGDVVGYIPKDHPRVEDIERRIAAGLLDDLPEAVPPSVTVTRVTDVQKLGALLVSKGLITAQELFDAGYDVKG